MKILIDMNLSPLWVPFFDSHGFEAVRVGQPSAPDTAILRYAADEGYIIFTHDLDFAMLLAIHKRSGPSVIQVRSQDVLPSAIGEAVVRAIKGAQTHLEKGALVTVDPIRQRIRLLPI
jgi:predicted nuclease of predicted toxin-antitoxin system